MKEIVLWVVAALLLTFGIPGCVDAYACRAQYGGLGETSWGPITGCMVKRNDKWIPSAVIREVTP